MQSESINNLSLETNSGENPANKLILDQNVDIFATRGFCCAINQLNYIEPALILTRLICPS